MVNAQAGMPNFGHSQDSEETFWRVVPVLSLGPFVVVVVVELMTPINGPVMWDGL